jgi:ABC-type branched-subunit amino acid transport system ATPase component
MRHSKVIGGGPRRMPRRCARAGTSPAIPGLSIRTAISIIRGIRDAGTTVLLVEQNAFAALEMCDHAYLLEGGRIVLSGAGAEMIENAHVRKAYLGG